MRLGLVLGAGGYPAQAFHAGALAALAEVTGWDPRAAELIVGTSAGAVVGAFLRAGVGAPDLYARAVGGRLSDDAAHILGEHHTITHGPPCERRRLRPSSVGLLTRGLRDPRGLTAARVASAVLPAGVRRTEFIERAVTATIGHAWPMSPLWVTAVNLRSGELVAFGRADAPAATLGRALAASCAVPGFFAPVTVGDERYLDGAVRSPTNADLIAGQGLDLVVVSSPMSQPRGLRRRSWDLPARTLCRRLLARELARLRGGGATVLVLQPVGEELEAMRGSPMQPHGWERAAAHTRESVRRWLTRPAVRTRLAAPGRVRADG